MALTTYDSVSLPYFAGTSFGNGVLVNSTVSAAISLVSSSNAGEGFPDVAAGDVFLVDLVFPSSVSVSTIVPNGGSLTFTRKTTATIGSVKHELWVATAAAEIPGVIVLTVTLTGSVGGWGAATWLVKNTIGFDATFANASGTGTTASLTAVAPAHANVLTYFSVAEYNAANTTPPILTAATGVPFQFIGSSAPAAGVDVPIRGSATSSSLNYSIAAFLGTGVTPTISATTAASLPWSAINATFYGPTIQMDDLTYLLTEAGTLLGNPSNTLPIYDIDSIQGLTDLNMQTSIDQIDGADGSYVSSIFATGKTVVIDGTIYAASPFDEGLLDTLKLQCSPTKVGVPFYYKLPNKTPRCLTVKPIDFKSSMDRSRGLSQVPFEMQLQSEDARAYSDYGIATNTSASASIYVIQVAQGGNVEMFPYIYFDYLLSDANTGVFSFWAPTWMGEKMPLSEVFALSPAGLITVDVSKLSKGFSYRLNPYKRALELFEGVGGPTAQLWFDVSIGLVNRAWFSLIPGRTNQIYMTRPGGASPAEGFSIQYANAWR